jgi:peroxiredoxin
VPGYERQYDVLRDKGVDEVICLAVNDAFVMFQWGRSLNVEKVFLLPDGNGEFTRKMGMLVDRSSNGLGMRSWRYSVHVVDREIKRAFIEPGFRDNPDGVPVKVTSAETMLEYLRASN